VPAGGPDGGDGGRGGDVVVVADSPDTTLSAYRERRKFVAANGRPGEGGRRTGRDGEPTVLHVPAGTMVHEGETVLGDLDRAGATVVVARGGRGGRGNARFATSARQAPRLGELGERGERRRIHLELKLIADIGLVGLPNAGKSTLLAALTGAHPKVAAYPFTTLHPNLGVAELGSGRTVVLADVPGLIEGAHRGAGLGIDFLRHLERTRAMIHVVDVSAGAAAARDALRTVESELTAFSATLARRPRVVALNKIDVDGAPAAAAILQAELPDSFPISAATGTGCSVLLEAAAARADLAPPPLPVTVAPASPEHRVYRHRPRYARPIVTREGDAFRVSGDAIERIVARVDLDNEEAVQRLQRRLRAAGVDDALRAAGCKGGETVRIGDAEFLFTDSETL
jgi:GTPase